MIKKKMNFILVVFAIALLLLTGCASKPGFEGKGDLVGMIIDENNKPVRDFVVFCSSGTKPVVTNESGIFAFYDVPSGEYFLSGEKEGYLRLENVSYNFDDRSKFIVMQTKSFKAAVLNAEELIRLGQAEDARNVLGGICCQPGSSEELFFTEYIAKLEER